MSETDLARVSFGLRDSFRIALSITLVREEIVLSELVRRLGIGGAIVGLQFLCLWWVDRVNAQMSPALATAYVQDAFVFWATFWPSALVVALAIFGWRLRDAFGYVRGEMFAEKVLIAGERIAADMRRADVARDEKRMFVAHKRAMSWQRAELPALLASNPAIKSAFDASTCRGGPYASDWQIAATWIPSMDRDTGKLRDALEAGEAAKVKARGGGTADA